MKNTSIDRADSERQTDPVDDSRYLAAHRRLTVVATGLSLGLYTFALWSLMLWLPAPDRLWATVVLGVAVITVTPLRARLIDMLARPQQRKPISETPLQLRPARPGSLSGRTLGGYTLLDLIDKGGAGEVYTAQSGGLLLAVKVLDMTYSTDRLMRFEREVTMLRQARHPNVVQVFDSGLQDGYAYMVMEFIDGVNLQDRIEMDAPLPLHEVMDIVRGIAAAADHMHQLGIIHRDLKPGNIMLYWDDSGRCIPMLLDFGVAKDRAVTVITLEGTVGTVEYMSPEQILDAPLVQPTSDVYAVGVMVYEMLTGQLPYDGSMGAIVFGHLHGKVRNPRDVNPSISPDVAAAICRAMAKVPEERFATVAEFVWAIDKGYPTHSSKNA